MRLILLTLLTALSACSETPVGNTGEQSSEERRNNNDNVSPGQMTTPAGIYRIDLNPKIDNADLPSNADLKMVDGDISKYAQKLCGLDFANKAAPNRCEIFAQSDRSGLLTGYVTLQQAGDVRIDTAIETDRQKSGLGCFVSGTLENSSFEQPEAKLEISGDFEARLPFFAWEKSPGDWMVSSEDTDENSAGGMWYVKRLGDNLRVSQERWNYCYRDSGIYIDEVFRRVATVTKAS